MCSRIALIFLLLSTSGLAAQTPPAKDCGLSSIQICALHVAQDEVGIVTAPLRITQSDVPWIAAFAVGTGVGIDKDAEAIKALGVDKNREDKFRRVSDVGGLYGPAGAVTIGFFIGRAKHNDHLQETSILAEEAMADSFILNTGLGYAINRQTPRQGDGTGRFWPHGTKTWPDGQSMPSDHSILAWSFAHVVASEYDGIGTKLLVYSLATTVSASRVIAREHFPSDVFVGAALGYFIGGYVINRRTDRGKWDGLALSPVRTPNGNGMQLCYNFAH